MATITTEEPATTTSPQPYYVPKYPLPEQIVASIEEQMANDELMDFMVNACSGHLFDTKEGSERRKRVIDKLSTMLRTWAIEVGKTKEVSDEHLQDGGGIQVQIFGSTKLEVHNIDSDIDMLCIAPSYVTRSDFFTSFKKMLLESTDVENLLAIPEAYTPVIKFIMDGQSVDMVFASLQAPTLPNPVDALDLRWLTGLDEQSVRSLNGVRVAEWICKLVPDLFSFRITLRVIKYWAKQRGLYSNILGFLGGVNYALLVALVCQTFPDLCPYSLVRKFFAMYTMWTWPTPVMLRRFEDLQFKDSDGRYLPVWNPLVNFKDSLHIMPIITPAYPAMNSAYNIAQPQFRCIMVSFAFNFLSLDPNRMHVYRMNLYVRMLHFKVIHTQLDSRGTSYLILQLKSFFRNIHAIFRYIFVKLYTQNMNLPLFSIRLIFQQKVRKSIVFGLGG